MEGNAPAENDIANENVEDEEEVITIDDLVHINESLARQAELLLGGQDESACTYPEGYKYRQPLYACLTCAADNGGQPAGVCYACCCNCHDGHDLVEMFTKRKFCCDCGNSKFKSKCKLYEEKCEENALNKYNDNFKRIYCVCKQTYPPSAADEAETEDAGEMHQCCICEDWFHLSHIFDEPALVEVAEQLQSQRDTDADDGELLCRGCVARLPFLLHYTINEKKKEGDEKDEEIKDEAKPVQESDGSDPASAARADGENVAPSAAPPASSTGCKLEALKAKHAGRQLTPESRHVCSTWRLALCRCTKCMNMYDLEDCAFLVDPEDTMTHYDAERQRNMRLNGETELAADDGRPSTAAGGRSVASGSKRLGSDIEDLMYDIVVKKTNNHDAALNAYLHVKQMYAHLGEFFVKCADKDKPITRGDIERCFEELNAKRPRLSTPGEDGAWTQ